MNFPSSRLIDKPDPRRNADHHHSANEGDNKTDRAKAKDREQHRIDHRLAKNNTVQRPCKNTPRLNIRRSVPCPPQGRCQSKAYFVALSSRRLRRNWISSFSSLSCLFRTFLSPGV